MSDDGGTGGNEYDGAGWSPDVEAALATHADDYAVLEQLHDVPPYEVYEVRIDGRRAVCKLDAHPKGRAATEGQVQAYAARETPAPAPDVVAVGDDHYLAAWSDDAPSQDDGNLDVAKARTMGAAMARFHEGAAFERPGLPRASADAPGVEHCGSGSVEDGDGPSVGSDDGPSVEGGLPVETCDDWPATVEAYLEDLREYVAAVGHGDVVDAVSEFVADHPEVFEGAGDPVLCHANWLPDHVGVDPEGTTPAPRRDDPVPGAATCVIDFEHALVGPAEYDVRRTLPPLASNPIDGLAEAFLEGYEAVRPLPSGFDRREDAYRVVVSVQYLSALHLQGNVPEDEREERAEQFSSSVFETLDDLRG